MLIGTRSSASDTSTGRSVMTHEQPVGRGLAARTVEACRLRLRPILMTSFAFIMGVVPLVIAHGAGAEMRQAMGIAVFAGMIGVTLFGLFLTPVFFVTIESFTRRRRATSFDSVGDAAANRA